MNSMWFLLGFFFIILEVGHPGLLYFLALAGGSFTALGASYFCFSTEVQNIIFFTVSLMTIVLIHFFVRKAASDSRSHRSNIDQLISKVVTIISIESKKAGACKLGGELWSIKLQGDGELKVGMKAIVVGIKGCHLQVKPL